ncbi:U-box domain-containing protein 13 [Platanthera zijinensis]|uniref:U-box domain-containing protein 13 n=1 Tax=Platanthera zijinensis TaxID=2320716 RepID=A0AAP0GCF6_9ASPA
MDLQRHDAMKIRLLVKRNPENRLKISRAGVDFHLISLLNFPPQITCVLHKNGVTVILNLLLCDENKHMIVGGAIKPLVRVLKNIMALPLRFYTRVHCFSFPRSMSTRPLSALSVPSRISSIFSKPAALGLRRMPPPPFTPSASSGGCKNFFQCR